MVKKQNCAIWVQTVSLYTSKQIIFIEMLQTMLKQDLSFQIMNQNAIPQRDHCVKEKNKNSLNE